METTILELRKRINNLELIVNQQDDDNEPLTTQINSLKLKLAKIYQTHPEFEKLNQLNSKHGIIQLPNTTIMIFQKKLN